MRKITAGFAVSVDGFIEGPHGEYDWIIIDKEFDFAEHMKRIDTFLMGRKTYEMVSKMEGNAFPHIKNYVFSNTITEVAEGYTLIKKDIKEAVEEIKNGEGKDIAVFGGATLLASLLNLGLVDELVLSVIPIILGRGKPMFGEIYSRIPLKFSHSRTLPNGTIMLTYQVTNS
jgi:dihydrofolate reductase